MTNEHKEAMRKDYEAGLSVRALALKYGCSKSAVSKWARREGWEHGQVDAPPEVSISDDDKPFNKLAALCAVLLDRISESLNRDEPISTRDLRSLAAALLDVRQLLNAVSPLEAEAQRLRIEGLRREIETASSGEVIVRFVDTDSAEK